MTVDFKTQYDSEENVKKAIDTYMGTKPFDFTQTKEITVADLAKSFHEWAQTTAWEQGLGIEDYNFQHMDRSGQVDAGALFQGKSKNIKNFTHLL